MKKQLIILASLLAVVSFVKPANADVILGGELFYTGGDVTVYLIGGEAAYHNFLALYADGDSSSAEELLENHDAFGTMASISAADMVNLGYEVGDALAFGIEVYTGGTHDNPSGTPIVYFMGPGENNPDGVIHAILVDTWAPDVYFVGFEDLWLGGDEDFNDTVFAFTEGVIGVPEPGTLLLLGAGLIGIGARRRIKAKS